MSKRIIIIGASSGIGRALAEHYLSKGWNVGITGRRKHLLEEIKEQDPDRIFVRTMDVTDPHQAIQKLRSLIDNMGGVDVVVVNAGVGDTVPSLEEELKIIHTNVLGFVAMTRTALDYFKKEEVKGQIVGITSIAGARGFRIGTVYGASKRFDSHYLNGLRHFIKKKKLNIKITDIRPGFIDTDLSEEARIKFWSVPVKKATPLIAKAIDRQRVVAYIPGYWRIIYFLFQMTPQWFIKWI